MSDQEQLSSPPREHESSPVREPVSSPAFEVVSSPRDPPSSPPLLYESDESVSPKRPCLETFREAVPRSRHIYWPQQQEDGEEEHTSTDMFDCGLDSSFPDDGGHLSDNECQNSPIASSSSEDDGLRDSEDNASSADGSDGNGYESSSSESSEVSTVCSDESDAEESLLMVSDGSPLSVDEGVLILMELFVEQRLEKKSLGKILKAVLKFLPENNNMPQTQHGIFQYVEKLCPLPEEKVHYYCKRCHLYFGMESSRKCNNCGHNINEKFFQLSLEDQIRNYFENHNLADYIDKYAAEREQKCQAGVFCDICDGSEYKRVHLPGQYSLTLLGHTDGVAVTVSGDASLWPMEYIILELPPHLRFKFILVNGVWLDASKPNFNAYFGPFADELDNLHNTGARWVHPRTKVSHKSNMVCPGFCADAPVRAQIQNILSHGGRYSCHACEQKMVKLPAEPVLPGVQRKKRKRIYAFQEVPGQLRSAERMKAQGKITLARKIEAAGGKFKPEKGVLGRSVMSKLPLCDRSTVVFPEYMHLVLGILKQFMVLWFNCDKESPYSLKAHQDAINEFLLSIRVPDYVTRIPRSTECFTKWKANEFRSFLIYFSVVVLSQFMQPQYFQHWLFFVCALEILLRDKILEVDVLKAELMLRIFVRNFPRLYKPQDMTYNLHNLLHLGLTVRRWGNLQFHSAFQFENFNGILSKCIHGSKNQGKELVNTTRITCGINILRARVENSGISSSVQGKIELRSEIKLYTPCDTEACLLTTLTSAASASFYYRAVVGKEVYTCSLYTRQVKRNNFTICYESNSGNQKYGEVKCYVQGLGDFMAIVNPFRINHMQTFVVEELAYVVRHILPIIPTVDKELVPVKKFVSKVIRVGNCVCLRPNTYEVNL